MKKLICAVIALVLLTSCSQYAEPDVSVLMEELLSGQDTEEMTAATAEEVGILFDIDLSLAEDFAVSYSGKGGCADIVAIFKLNSKEDAPDAAAVLEKYREDRYNDFLGYAPFEAEKIENGRVLTYGRYVILIVLPDIESALSAAEKAFKA